MNTLTRKTRVLVADDHGLVLEGIKALLEKDFDVVGTATNGRDLVEMAAVVQPDVIVLDIGISLLNGLDAGRRLRQAVPSARLLYLSIKMDLVLAARAISVGAAGYVLKSAAASELRKAIREVAAGRTYLTPSVEAALSRLHFAKNDGSRPMTLRQREVIQLLAEGGSMKEVASMLKISARTVAYHKYTVMQQHRLRTNAELIQFAIKEHMVSM